MNKTIWNISEGEGPLAVAAIHDGHDVRPSLLSLMSISEEGRLREEDPYTAAWTEVANVRIAGTRSRFEVDLNRPREKSVYRVPEDAWGLEVWKAELPEDEVRESLAEYDAFYAAARKLFDGLVKKHGRFVVFDLHTYNHRRNGPDAPPADPSTDPEVNIGTGTMDRTYWTPVVERFMGDLSTFDFLGRNLDVRENVKFKGGNFSRWIHETFPHVGCSIAIEFKKFFMDEWSGECDEKQHAAITEALRSTTTGVLEELQKLG